ncbi:alpha/beta hydrolase [Allorhodopirellula solitaria]|uniref:Alpha/beta hydrolase family protein n=1 Tax=Allorhodopirellula solitaria TaxID=2527987 RepID=A0A5C5XZY2_9BACT|nr:alpha/beta hydrolase [Allorhodopirellula solitaria]TWT67515.1 Alpha/beta hydrolase family protein [Allorhodopirellula solitaria]
MENEADPTPGPIQPTRPRPPALRRRGLRLLVLILIGYAAICVTLVYMETRLVFPGAFLEAAPQATADRYSSEQPIQDSVTTLAYEAVDGSELLGRILVRKNPDRVILFLHGNEIRATELDGWTEQLSHVANATVLTAEYRGFQPDGFTPTEASVIDDALSSVRALSKVTDVAPEEITIYGRSLGGGIAAGLVEAMDAPPQSLILDRTFDSAMEIGAEQYFWLPVRWLMSNPFNSSIRLRGFSGNVVSVHGTPDQIVPMKNGRALFDSLTTPHKTWIEVPGLYHNDSMSTQTLRQEFEALRALEAARSTTAEEPSGAAPVL